MKTIPQDNYPSKVWPIIKIACRIVQGEPAILDDEPRFKAALALQVPQLRDRSKCVGCERSMKITAYEADLHDALLIYAMSQKVKENLRAGIDFTNANKVHIPTLEATQATLKRQTKCDYLGLIKQPENWRGSGFWLLTNWGYKALRDEPIPDTAYYWEGNFLGRSDTTITMGEMFKKHKDLVERAILLRKTIQADYRAKFEDYDPKEWVGFKEAPVQEELL